jgi:hypothetical protein
LGQQCLFGRTTIESKQVTLIYGRDEPPDKAVFGQSEEKLIERDRKVTDVEKAYFAHTRQSKRQIVRPFYLLDNDDAAAIRELVANNLNQYIIETNRS